MRTIFEGAAIGIIRVDRAGRVIEVNPALEQMLGYSAAELMVMKFHPASSRGPNCTSPRTLRESGRR